MRGHSLAIANHSTSHLAWQLTGWSPRQVLDFPIHSCPNLVPQKA